MIGVGINEDVLIVKAGFTDNAVLELELGSAKDGKEKKSVFESLLSAQTAADPSSNLKLKIWATKISPKADKTNAEKIQLAANDNIALIKKLSQILEQFITLDKIDLESVQFNNTGIIDQETLNARYLDQDVQNRIYDNICKRFIQLISPYINNPEFAVRFKLIRQSKDKHFATIPSRYITENPFIELMSVPKENSRVHFNKWELDNGLNDGTPAPQTTAEAKDGGEASPLPGGTVTASPVPDSNPFA
jgi:hypothetical protein